MAKYNGTVILSGMISPTDTTDAYPTHEDILGKGGYRTVVDITERDNISTQRRKNGMMVFVETDGKTYQLQGGIDNTNWVEFTTGTSSTIEELVQTDIPVSGIINTLFAGITIPNNEILYVRGNDGGIEPKVYSGTLSTVLVNNKYNDFIIKYDGTSSVVYVNSNVDISHVQNAINDYPKGYDIIDLSTNTVSAKISDLLTQTYNGALQIFALEGIMSTVEQEDNTFNALNKDREAVIMYDGNSLTAYKKQKVTISYLQERKLIN